MATFVQIIEYETDRPDEVMALGSTEADQAIAQPAYTKLTVTQDRDRPNRYLTIVEFPSIEAASANNGQPQTQQFARKLSELCTSGPVYRNLSAVYTVP